MASNGEANGSESEGRSARPSEADKEYTIDDLSEQQISDLREAFNIFDREGDGHIDPRKLGKVMKILGRNPTEAEVQDLIQAVDDNGNGQIEFAEFATMMAKQIQGQSPEEEIREAFRCFDKNSNGFLAADEIGGLLEHLGMSFTEDEVLDMARAADRDGDKQVSLEDFMQSFMEDT